MRFVDPYALKLKASRETVIFAASQHRGDQPIQEDYFLNFNDECFVLADGRGVLPQGDAAARFAAETAIWAFKHIRQHRYYWLDKKLFMKRIFRSTNMAVWQKRREAGFESGIATSLMVLIVGGRNYWLGSVGHTSAWIFRRGSMKKLTPDTSTFSEDEQDVLGARRLGLVPMYTTGVFAAGDVMVMTSSGCGNYLAPADLHTAATVGNSAEDATRAVTEILSAARVNGSSENRTAVIVKRLEFG